jgi:hypothetical protein
VQAKRRHRHVFNDIRTRLCAMDADQ